MSMSHYSKGLILCWDFVKYGFKKPEHKSQGHRTSLQDRVLRKSLKITSFARHSKTGGLQNINEVLKHDLFTVSIYFLFFFNLCYY